MRISNRSALRHFISFKLRLLLSLSLVIGASTGLAYSQPAPKLPSAEKIIEGYLKAIGGKKKARSIQDSTYEYGIKFQDGGSSTARILSKSPGSYRSEINLEKGQIISSANQRSAWVLQIESGLRTLTGQEAGAAKLHAILDAAHLIDYKKSNVMARVIGLDNSFGEPAYALEFSSRAGARLKYFFNTTSRLLIGLQDDTRQLTIGFADYRPKGLILEPHTIRIKHAQTVEVVLALERAVYNSGVGADAFDPPRSAEAFDVRELLREVSRNQDAVEKRVSEYSFLRKQTDRELDSKGVLKKETVKVFEVFPLPNRRPVFKLVSENGVTLAGDRAAKEEKRVLEEFMKAERDKEKDAEKAEERKVQREREKAKQKEQDEDDCLRFPGPPRLQTTDAPGEFDCEAGWRRLDRSSGQAGHSPRGAAGGRLQDRRRLAGVAAAGRGPGLGTDAFEGRNLDASVCPTESLN
jgi:hypothetical protein